MPTLLVLSTAAVNTPHRKAFDVLAREHGWEVHLVAPTGIEIAGGLRKPCDPVTPGAAYHLHTRDLFRPDSGRITWFSGVGSIIRRTRPDVIFAEFDPGSVAILQAYALSRGVGSKVVAYTVENIPSDRWRDARRNAARLDLRGAARDAFVGSLILGGRRASAAIACLNDDGRHIYRDLRGWSQPTELVPLGVDMELFRPMDSRSLRESLGLGAKFVVGYFGRLVPEKRIDLLIDALAGLPDDVALLLDMFRNFAPGSHAAELMRLAERRGIRDRVVTIDVDHGEVPRYMNCCDVVALVSSEVGRFKEQYGRVLPEAMACGVPVLGTRSGNISAIIGEAGILVPQGSVDAVRDAILRLRNDPALRADLASRGRERVRTHWSVEVQAARLDALMRPLLSR